MLKPSSFVKSAVFLFKNKANEILSIKSEKLQVVFKRFARKRRLMTSYLTGSQFFELQMKEKTRHVVSKNTNLVKIVSLCSSAGQHL